MSIDFPNDADGDVLRSLSDKGINLQESRIIEFYCYAKTRQVAERIVQEAEFPEFDVEIFESDSDENSDAVFSVYFSKQMVPSYKSLIQIQDELNSILAAFDTVCDGWGTLVDPQECHDAENA